MLKDEAEIVIRGGHGGAGIISFGKKAHSGPDGGNGGSGGDYYIRAVSDLTLLNQFSSKTVFASGDGESGGRNKRTGKDGEDHELLLPVGAVVINKKTGEEIVKLDKVGQRILLCKGGEGGRGNFEFRSSTMTTPRIAEPGKPGEKLKLKIVLKLIADFGLVGLPNAGKSSLLNEITRAKAKIADYPFTTLSPNLGVYDQKVLADIPGLIEGASEGKGLGISFLKHIEKVKVILHCISSESEDPLKDYAVIRKEMKEYKPKLLRKKEIILITKSDLADEKKLKKFIKLFNDEAKEVLTVSIHDWDSLEKLKKIISPSN